MTKLEIQGDWNIVKGKLKQKCAKLSEDDIHLADGKHDESLGKSQKQAGLAQEAAEAAKIAPPPAKD